MRIAIPAFAHPREKPPLKDLFHLNSRHMDGPSGKIVPWKKSKKQKLRSSFSQGMNGFLLHWYLWRNLSFKMSTLYLWYGYLLVWFWLSRNRGKIILIIFLWHLVWFIVFSSPLGFGNSEDSSVLEPEEILSTETDSKTADNLQTYSLYHSSVPGQIVTRINSCSVGTLGKPYVFMKPSGEPNTMKQI